MSKLMEQNVPTATESKQWVLPPLILHPFTGDQSAEHLLAGSKAMLLMHGMASEESADSTRLTELILRGRVQEVRMLYFLGKDLLRWTEQCTDFASRQPELTSSGIRAQSFASLLVEGTPRAVAQKLALWGVTDHKAVFSRAIGITSCFGEPPSAQSMAASFLENYHRFADYLFVCYQALVPYFPLSAQRFAFELYASAEYSDMLSKKWLSDS